MKARDRDLSGIRALITRVCNEVDAVELIRTSIEQCKIVHPAVSNG